MRKKEWKKLVFPFEKKNTKLLKPKIIIYLGHLKGEWDLKFVFTFWMIYCPLN